MSKKDEECCKDECCCCASEDSCRCEDDGCCCCCDEEAGPDETGFLDLEVSKVLYSEAQSQIGEAVREIMFEAIKARIKERFGEQLQAMGRLAADEYVDDVELNLSIEEHISARRERQAMLDLKIKEALAGVIPEPAQAEEVVEEAPAKPAGRGRKKS